MKNLFLVLMACCLFTSCKPNTQSDISAELAISSLEAFYSNLDVDTYGSTAWSEIVTSDFKVFEAGKQMDLDAFLKYSKPSQDLAQTNWEFSALDILLDKNTAHISFINDGFFKHSNLEVKVKWMESVLLVMDEGKLKLRFLNSNLLDREVTRFENR